MYMPPHFEEKRTEIIQQFIREHGFGTLVTLDPDGLNANHFPFEFDPEPAPFGTLRAHIARNNPLWRTFSRDVDALAIFQGAHAYITPSWYVNKRETGKVVPTYNYLAVHAHGPLRVIDDPAWLRAFVERLTNRHEANRAERWKIDDAPADYLSKMLGAIVGLEIPIAKLEGKWKASQNQPQANRAGIVAGLREIGDAGSMGMAEIVGRV